MKILMICTEASPFAKAGGLADVTGPLAKALRRLGHDARLVIPRYGFIDPEHFGLTLAIESLDVPYEETTHTVRIMEARLDGQVPVYFVDCAKLFHREDIYGYADDGERFVCFSRAAIEMLKHIHWQPDILHCYDWHTGIIPNWLKTLYKGDRAFASTAALFTIHDLQDQGIFGWRVLQVAGVAQHGFIYHPQISELDRVVDLTARGIIFADAITTISERYAQEILTPEYGEKLDPLLRERQDRLFGITNGIDQDVFNPASDPHIARLYDVSTLSWRIVNKTALQREAHLRVDETVPLIGMVSRLAAHRGFDLLAETIDHILRLGIQFVLVGTGDQHYHEIFTRVARSYPQQAAVFLTFNADLAQKVYAGSDIFLMPCRAKPGGVSPMIAMRYGAVPVARETGALADLVKDWDPATRTGNGFVFKEYDRWALFAAVVRAIETYRYKDIWRAIQVAGMSADYSWERSAQKYVEVYQKALAFKKETTT